MELSVFEFNCKGFIRGQSPDPGKGVNRLSTVVLGTSVF